MSKQIAARLNDILLGLTFRRNPDDLATIQLSEYARKAIVSALVPEIQKMIIENVARLTR